MNTPLEIIYPQWFGELDVMQTMMIEKNVEKLVLCENASEIFARIKDVHGVLETMLQHVIDKYATFPIINLGSITVDEDDLETWMPSVETKKGSSYIVHIGLENAGHYGIVIVDARKKCERCIVFDSMLVPRNSGTSFYTNDLSRIAKRIFPWITTIVLPTGIEFCPQPTGGSIWLQPDEPEFFDEITSLESQDHFCYIWAIWFMETWLTANGMCKKLSVTPVQFIKKYANDLLFECYTPRQIKQLIRQAFDKSTTKDATFLYRFFTTYFPECFIK